METVSKTIVLTALDDAGTGQVIPNGSRFEVRGSKFEGGGVRKVLGANVEPRT